MPERVHITVAIALALVATSCAGGATAEDRTPSADLLRRRMNGPLPHVPLRRPSRNQSGPRRGAEGLVIAAAVVALLLTACRGTAAPPSGPWLAIASPATGAVLSGTVAVAAAGVGGPAANLVFRLGAVEAAADADGIAILDTRSVPDGPLVLEARATVAGDGVTAQVAIEVRNDLPAGASIGADGGTLRTASGSAATLPPGALTAPGDVTVADTTQAAILQEFGIDYPALGVTFLGAVTISLDGVPRPERPIGLEMADWATFVQPNQQAVMFTIAPDADGDGIGELTFAANAMVAPGGSLISRPTPVAQVYGFGTSAVPSRAQASARPGQLVTVSGRGFQAAAVLSNAVRFTGLNDLLMIAEPADDATFNPLMRVRFAAPDLGAGSHPFTLHDLTTGYGSAATTLSLTAATGGSATNYAAFVAQVRIAVLKLIGGRPDLTDATAIWLATLDASTSPVAYAMASASGVATAPHRATLEALDPTAPTAAHRELLHDHALVLDAIAASVPTLRAAADLATLLVTLTPAASGAGTTAWRAQTSRSCSGSSATLRISFGTPSGGGSAGAGSCTGGSTAGSGSMGTNGRAASADDVMRSSHRAGGLRSYGGALVRIFRQGTTEPLTPFTAMTDSSGAFFLPFLPPHEPFTIRAVDPLTSATATADGVTGPVDGFVTTHLVFTPADQAGGEVEVTATPQPQPGAYRFELATALPPGAYAYAWEVGTGAAISSTTPSVAYQFLRSGSYLVRLAVTDLATLTTLTGEVRVTVVLDQPLAATLPTFLARCASCTISAFSVDDDGERVAFGTFESLVPGDANARRDIYVVTRATGALARASVTASGDDIADVHFETPFLSGDGQTLAFTGDDGAYPLVVKRLGDGAITTVAPPLGFTRVLQPRLSGDGRYLAFQAEGPGSGVFVLDLVTDTLTRASTGFAGATLAYGTTPAISPDGATVTFRSPCHADDGSLVGGECLYAFDRVSGAVARLTPPYPFSNSLYVAPKPFGLDGRLFAFSSEATNVVSPDGNGIESDVYLLDRVAGTYERVSVNAAGAALETDSFDGTPSADGRWVLFTSYARNALPHTRAQLDAICPACDFSATPGFPYVKDRVTGNVAVVAIGPNDVLPDEYTVGTLSADGRYVIFCSGTFLTTPTLSWVANPLWAP
jgi:hypothetical protein